MGPANAGSESLSAGTVSHDTVKPSLNCHVRNFVTSCASNNDDKGHQWIWCFSVSESHSGFVLKQFRSELYSVVSFASRQDARLASLR